MNLSAFKEHLMTALATSALLGGSAMVVKQEVTAARHDERLTRLENLDDSIDDLTKEMARTREQLARVEAKQE